MDSFSLYKQEANCSRFDKLLFYIYQLNFHSGLSHTQTQRVEVNGVIVLDT